MRRFFLPLSFLLALLVGCSCEDYSCDENGCQVCTGDTCTPVDPPERPACESDAQCPGDELVCSDLGCLTPCTVDGMCLRGTVCRDGYCLGPAEPEPSLKPGSCVVSADCQSSGVECIDGSCFASGETCNEDAECPGGRCVNGLCEANEALCQFNYECGDAGKECVDGECVVICDGPNQCPEGQACDTNEGRCLDILVPMDQCTYNSDCGDGFVCRSAVCRDACTEDSECADDLYCNEGICEVDDRPKPFCTQDSQCKAGPCKKGVCRSSCGSTDQCKKYDNQFVMCDPDGYCLTQVEANSDCSLSSECLAGQECINGSCS